MYSYKLIDSIEWLLMGDWLAQDQGKRIMSNANMLWLVHVQYIKIWRVKCPCLAEGECSCECSRLERHTAVGKAEHSVPMQETNLEFFGFWMWFFGSKVMSWANQSIKSMSGPHLSSRPGAGCWFFNDEKWGKYPSRLCLKWWYLNFYTIPP